jgi:hypothetical protein
MKTLIAILVITAGLLPAASLSGTVTGTTAVSVRITGNGISQTATTDATGAYLFSSLNSASYVIAPYKYGYKFSPVSVTVALGATDVTGVNFTAIPNRFSVYGKVTGAASVTLSLSGTASKTATTASDGRYAFTSLVEGSYTVTPSLAGYTFSPASRSFSSVSTDISALDFAASAIPPPVSHSVTLSWTASTTPSIDGYRIYRATADGGPYVQVATGITTTSYLDAAVTAGSTYYYVATAYNVDGESVYSNQATAVVPTP